MGVGLFKEILSDIQTYINLKFLREKAITSELEIGIVDRKVVRAHPRLLIRTWYICKPGIFFFPVTK